MIIKADSDDEAEESVIHVRNSSVQANLEIDKTVLEKMSKECDGHARVQPEEEAVAKAMGGTERLYANRYFPIN